MTALPRPDMAQLDADALRADWRRTFPQQHDLADCPDPFADAEWADLGRDPRIPPGWAVMASGVLGAALAVLLAYWASGVIAKALVEAALAAVAPGG